MNEGEVYGRLCVYVCVRARVWTCVLVCARWTEPDENITEEKGPWSSSFLGFDSRETASLAIFNVYPDLSFPLLVLGFSKANFSSQSEQKQPSFEHDQLEHPALAHASWQLQPLAGSEETIAKIPNNKLTKINNFILKKILIQMFYSRNKIWFFRLNKYFFNLA